MSFKTHDERGGRSDLVDLDVIVRRETDKAYGIADPDTPGGIIWLPKSQCEVSDFKMPQRTAILTLPEWLAIERGLV